MHPFLVILLNLCIAVVIYGILFSHAKLRGIDSEDVCSGPSVPVLLVQILISAMLGSVLAALLLLYMSVALGLHLFDMFVACGLIIFGCSIPSFLPGKSGARGKLSQVARVVHFPAFFVIFCFWYFISKHEAGASQVAEPMLWLSSVAVLTGFLATSMHEGGLVSAIRFYPEMKFWGWLMSATGVLLAVLTTYYFWISFGLPIILLAAAAMLGVTLLTGVWIRWSFKTQSDPQKSFMPTA